MKGLVRVEHLPWQDSILRIYLPYGLVAKLIQEVRNEGGGGGGGVRRGREGERRERNCRRGGEGKGSLDKERGGLVNECLLAALMTKHEPFFSRRIVTGVRG